LVIQRQTRTVGVLIRIEEDICSVIFVVTETIALVSVSVAEQGGVAGEVVLSCATVGLQFQDILARACGEVESRLSRSHFDGD
jgi:hypothetical protein